jgi:hypothetical protein
MQIPGVDYTEHYSPVANDTTIRVLIALTLYNAHLDWTCEVFDVEAAFLEADLAHIQYIEWPEGIVELGFLSEEETKTTCIRLNKSMYGTVDAPIQWMKTLSKYLMQSMGLLRSKIDPCLFIKKHNGQWNGKTELLVTTFVDDLAVSGTTNSIKWFAEQMQKRFKIKKLGRLKKHLGVWYEWSRDENNNICIKASMNEIIQEASDKFLNVIGHVANLAPTPGYPNKTLSKHKGDPIMITEYRSLVGKCMYYTTKVGPECVNAARELAQHMSNPGQEHWKALERMIGYLITQKGNGFTFQKPKELRVVAYADANYATNTDDL